MKFIKLASVFFVSTLSFTTVEAVTENLNVDQVRTLQSQIKNPAFLSVDLRQTKISASRPNRPTTFTGTAKFAKPNKFRWSLSGKHEEEVIFNGKDVTKIDPKEKIGTRFSAGATEANQLARIVDLVLNADKLLEEYTLLSASRTDDIVEISLQPKASQDLNQINLKLNMKSNAIIFVDMAFSNKSKLTVELSNPSFKELPPQTFEIPNDYKITEIK